MTPNDKQIDLLMRRYAQRAEPEIAIEHLEADEMSTFAEGALPPAARARYVSHLVACDQCRKQVAQLSISSGAVGRAESAIADPSKPQTFWQRLSALFAPRVLRYAAFAAILLIAAGITYIALRRPQRPNDLVASRTQGEQHPSSAVQPSAGATNGVTSASNGVPQKSGSPATLSTGSDQAEKRNVDKLSAAAPQPMITKEAPSAPAAETKKAATESDVTKSQPSYAPPPPGEAVQPANVGSVTPKREPQKTEAMDKIASADRERSQGFVLNQSRDDRQMKDQSVAQQRRANDEKARSGPSRNSENQANQMNRNANENRTESMPLSIAAPKAKNAEETRSIGGRKFRKQGSAWVDQKFKSSMTLKSVSRGSDEFNTLDSGLRSIAQELGGEVIILWKGKAYLIR